MWRCIFATLIANIMFIFPGVSAETKALVTVEACLILTEHIPADDVAYKGGVDVTGRPVKPADLAPAPDFGPALGLKDSISFALILDVAKESRGSDNAERLFQEHPGLRGEISLGQIVIKDGKVTLDGKPLTAEHQKELYAFCQQNKKLP